VTAAPFDDPCILFALARESSFFRRAYRCHKRFHTALWRAWLCGTAPRAVRVLETGIGAAHMQAALDWVLSQPILDGNRYRPRLIISAGFSGALDEDRRLGDLVLATEMADLEGNRWPTTWPGPLPPGPGLPPLHRGRLLAVSYLVANPEDKRNLSRTHGAVAVDMETATVARLCSTQGVPFGCLRVISDDIRTPLSPRLVTLFSEGRLSPLRVLRALLASPRLAAELWRLARQTRYAARELGKALAELLALTVFPPAERGPESGQGMTVPG
jgi:adenosylhomocysteine nucleosidase